MLNKVNPWHKAQVAIRKMLTNVSQPGDDCASADGLPIVSIETECAEERFFSGFIIRIGTVSCSLG